MLQIKNTLGGGKPEGLYAWKKNEIGSELKLLKKSVSTLPFNFASSSAVVLNGEIHILGSGYSGDYTKHYKWNGTSWTSASTLPYSFYSGSAVVFNNEIHLLGGNGNTTKHYKWDGSSWTSVSTLPYSFYDGSAVVFNNGIHILGSSTSSYRTAHYLIIGYAPVYTFLDYIVSDKETAYPDGGEKGGYWYEKVSVIDLVKIGCTKFEEGSVVLSSDSASMSLNHSLDVVPKFGLLYTDELPNSGAYVKNMSRVIRPSDGYDGYALFYGNALDGEYKYNYQGSGYTWTTTTAYFSCGSSQQFKSGITYNYVIFG